MSSLMGWTGRGFSDRRRSLFQIWRMMKTRVTLTVSRPRLQTFCLTLSTLRYRDNEEGSIFIFYFCIFMLLMKGAWWLSGRVLDSRQRGRGFEHHRRHCVVSLSKTH